MSRQPGKPAHRPADTGADAAGLPRSAWLVPLLMTLAVQSAASFLVRLPPIVAPILFVERGIGASAIGYLSGIGMAGSMAFLLLGAPLMARVGSVRTLQLGLIGGAIGAALIAVPSTALLVLGVFLMGLGYGPSVPASSDILRRFAPPNRQGLVFSIKQSGVPIGGMLGGAILPPLIGFGGLETALLFSGAVALLVAAGIEPVRSRVEPDGAGGSPLNFRSFVSAENLTDPIRALLSTEGLVRLSLSGLTLAISQGVWLAFLVTVFVDRAGMSLVAAGTLFAIMQAAGIVGRIALGWVADRTGSAVATLKAATGLSALCTLALAFIGPETSWPLLAALCLVAGATVTGWNGVQVSEVARLSPPGRVREAAAGATLLLFSGYAAGPAIFALFVEITGSYTGPLLAVAALTAASVLLPGGARPKGPVTAPGRSGSPEPPAR
ncbi:MFS transporter [Bosea sp. 124]|uniref:MFS transporter n=1 Tax=Bosea sp. 124 TaxID=2135642 RepID=UPI000D356DA3|nr:MFS transporter [Bosea sp. 124]PTM43410.1 sugar phosphate permease [Bosea sp. 124]